MRQVRTIEVTLAAPLDGRGRRSNETLLRLDGLAFAAIGAGSHDLWEVGRRSRRDCAR